MGSIKRFYHQDENLKTKEDVVEYIESFKETIGQLLYIIDIDDYQVIDLKKKINFAMAQDELDSATEIQINVAMNIVLEFIKEIVEEEPE